MVHNEVEVEYKVVGLMEAMLLELDGDVEIDKEGTKTLGRDEDVVMVVY